MAYADEHSLDVVMADPNPHHRSIADHPTAMETLEAVLKVATKSQRHKKYEEIIAKTWCLRAFVAKIKTFKTAS